MKGMCLVLDAEQLVVLWTVQFPLLLSHTVQ